MGVGGERKGSGLNGSQAAPGDPPTCEGLARQRGERCAPVEAVRAESQPGLLRGGLYGFTTRPGAVQPSSSPDNRLVRTESWFWKSSTQRSLAVTIFLLALIDMSNGPKTPLSPATCICPATGAAAGRRHPRRPAAGGTEPGAAHRGRAASLTQTPPRRPAGSSVREGRLPRRERHAAAPAHAPCSPLSRGFPRRPPRGGPTWLRAW